jgi:hypothetical protein
MNTLNDIISNQPPCKYGKLLSINLDPSEDPGFNLAYDYGRVLGIPKIERHVLMTGRSFGDYDYDETLRRWLYELCEPVDGSWVSTFFDDHDGLWYLISHKDFDFEAFEADLKNDSFDPNYLI